MILHLRGMEYAEKLKENCLAYWKATGTYNDAAGEALENFVKVFNGEDSPPGAAVLFTQFPCGSITVSKSFSNAFFLTILYVAYLKVKST